MAFQKVKALRNISEVRRSKPLSGGSLKSLKMIVVSAILRTQVISPSCVTNISKMIIINPSTPNDL
jgi:hypothetical protein